MISIKFNQYRYRFLFLHLKKIINYLTDEGI
jgi:hypothetical protein